MKVIDINHFLGNKKGQTGQKKKPNQKGELYSLQERAYARDKKHVGEELRNYFVDKNRQVQVWEVLSGLRNCIRSYCFSLEEAGKITGFLSRKYDIRQPDVDHAELFTPRAANESSMQSVTKGISEEKGKKFHQLFLSLQAVVQENFLEYNDARGIIREMVIYYPNTSEHLVL